MRKLYDWPFRGRPEINGAIFMFLLIGVLIAVWLIVLMAVINSR